MPPRSKTQTGTTADRARPRRYSADQKIRFLAAYDELADRAAKTRWLKDTGLSASLISQWRSQVYEAAREALAGEPGGQPARKIHLSKAIWGDLAALGAGLDPQMTPERYVRALCSWATGRDTRIPGHDAPARPAVPVRAGGGEAPAGGEAPRGAVHAPPVITGYIEQMLAGSLTDGAIPASKIPALAGTLTVLVARARRDQRLKDLSRMVKADLVLMCGSGVWTPDGRRVKIQGLPGDPPRSWDKERLVEEILAIEFRQPA